MWDYSPVHCSKLKCSYSSFLFSQSILTHCNQWSKLFQDSSPFQTPLYENIRTNQQIHRKFRWIFNKNLIIKWQRILQKYLRAAKFAIMIVEAKKDFLIRLTESVACTIVKIKVQIVLALHFASYNFADLKWNKLIFNKCFCNFTWRLCDLGNQSQVPLLHPLQP